MNERLQVEIGADISELKKSLGDTESALKTLENKIAKTDAAFKKAVATTVNASEAQEKLTKSYKEGATSQKDYSEGLERLQKEEKEASVQADNLQDELTQLSASYRKLGGSMNRMGSATSANATPALIAFTGIIQDAPYGIRGVANNIEFFSTSMLNLSRQTGGAMGAIKALLGSLAGPAGILFAISAVSSLLVVFGDKLFDSGKAAKTAEEKLNDYVDALDDVSKANLKGAQSAANELVQLRLLSQQATNTALSTKERVAAVNELRSLYPSYLKNMTNEEILANGLSTAYDQVAESIMKKARAQAASNVMVDNLEKQIALESKLAAVTVDAAEQNRKADRLEAAAIEAISKNIRGQETLRAKANTERERANDLLKEQKQLQGQIQSLELSNIDLVEDVKTSGDLIVEPKETKLTKGGREKIESVLSKDLALRINPEFQLVESQTFSKAIYDQIEAFEGILKTLPPASAEYAELAKTIQFLKSVMQPVNEGVADNLKQFEEDFKITGESIKEQTELMASSIGSFITGITGQLAEGGLTFESFARGIIKASGQVLAQLAQDAIRNIAIKKAEATANSIKAGTETAAASGPASAFVLPALVAAMVGVVGGAFAGLQGFAQGGMVGGTSYAGDKILARLNSGEGVLTAQGVRNAGMLVNAVSSGSASSMDVNVVSRISGDDIILVTDRAQRKRNRIG